MNKLIWLLFLLPAFAFGQNNISAKAIYSYNVSDTAAAKVTRTNLQSSYGSTGGLYFDKIRNKWKIWVGTCVTCAVDSTWIDLPLSGGGEILSFTSPLLKTGTTVSIPASTNSVNGYLTSADHTTFSNKENVLTFSEGLVRSGNTVNFGGPITTTRTITSGGNPIAKFITTGEPILGLNSATSSGIHGVDYVSIGNSANIGTSKIGDNSVAIGVGTKTKENNDISIGTFAGSTTGISNGGGVSIGYFSNAGGSTNIGDFSVAIGALSKSVASVGIGIGNEAESRAAGDISIGYRAGKNTTSSLGGNIMIGYQNSFHNSSTLLDNSISLGNDATVAERSQIAIGTQAGNTTGTQGREAITIGSLANQGTSNIGEDCIAIGGATKARNFRSIAFGYAGDVQEDYAMCVSQIDNIYFQTGWGLAPGTGGSGVRMQGGFPIGANLNSNERILRFASARATGTGTSGDILFEYSPPVASGSTLQSLATAATMTGTTGKFSFNLSTILANLSSDPSSTTNGEMWYNTTTNKLRTKENGVNVDVRGGTPAGSNTEIQFNNSSAFGASAALTWDGTNVKVGNSSTVYTTTQAASVTISNGSSTTPLVITTKSGNSSTVGNFAITSAATPLGSVTGDNNMILGMSPSTSITSGNNNILLGSNNSGPTSGSNNISLGNSLSFSSSPYSLTASNQIRISDLLSRDAAGEVYLTVTRTSCSGAPTGALANVAGVLTICP